MLYLRFYFFIFFLAIVSPFSLKFINIEGLCFLSLHNTFYLLFVPYTTVAKYANLYWYRQWKIYSFCFCFFCFCHCDQETCSTSFILSICYMDSYSHQPFSYYFTEIKLFPHQMNLILIFVSKHYSFAFIVFVNTLNRL